MYQYAIMLMKGDGVEKNTKLAAFYFKRSADLGYCNSIYSYGLLLISGSGVTKNKDEAIKYFKMAIDKGDNNSMYEYAKILYDDEFPNNKLEAAKYFKMAADNGHIKSMNIYSKMLKDGDGVQKDKKESEKYEKMFLCNQDNAKNKNEDKIYILNEEQQQLLKEKAYLYKMGAKQDDLESMFLYGVQLYFGYGVQVNKKKAAKYFKKAADRGHQVAIKNYAIMLLNGYGIEKNENEAINYFNLLHLNLNNVEVQKNHKNVELQKNQGNHIPNLSIFKQIFIFIAAFINFLKLLINNYK